MTEDSPGFGQRAKSALAHAKQTVGVGDPPLATEVGGRVEAVREALRAFGEGDMDRFLSALGDDVEWVAPKGDNFPGAGTLQGRDAVKERFVGAVSQSYAAFGFRPERYLEAVEENLVVVLGAFGGQGLKGASEFDAPSVQVWQFDGDKAVRVQIYADAESFPERASEEERQKAEKGEDDDDQKGEANHQAEGDQKSEGDHQAEGQNKGERDGGGAHQGEGGRPSGQGPDGQAGADGERERSLDVESQGAGDRAPGAQKREPSESTGEHAGDEQRGGGEKAPAGGGHEGD